MSYFVEQSSDNENAMVNMHVLFTRVFTAIVLSAFAHSATASSQGDLEIPEALKSVSKPPSELHLINPPQAISGKPIKLIRANLLAWDDELECKVDPQNSKNLKCNSMTLEPGPYVLKIVFCSKEDCSKFGEAWHSQLKLLVKPKEQVSIDLTRLTQSGVDEEKSIKRANLGALPANKCEAYVGSLFAVDACTAAGFTQLEALIRDVKNHCQIDSMRSQTRLVDAVFWHYAHLPIAHCYKSDQIAKLPDFLTSWYVEDGFWPKGSSLKNISSWKWGRKAQKRSLRVLESESDTKGLLKQIQEWKDKQSVVDQLIAAVLDPKQKLQPLLNAISSQSKSFDPSLPAGHRVYGLAALAKAVPEIGANQQVAKVLSEYFSKNTQKTPQNLEPAKQENESINCGQFNEAQIYINGLLADKLLSASDWGAVKHMIVSTEAEKTLTPCLKAVTFLDQKAIGLEERLSFLGDFDCSEKREGTLRGKGLSSIVANESLIPDAKVRVAIMKKFAHCIQF